MSFPYRVKHKADKYYSVLTSSYALVLTDFDVSWQVSKFDISFPKNHRLSLMEKLNLSYHRVMAPWKITSEMDAWLVELFKTII